MMATRISGMIPLIPPPPDEAACTYTRHLNEKQHTSECRLCVVSDVRHGFLSV